MTETFDPPREEDRGPVIGAVSVRGRPVRQAPLGWLPWVAFALLGLLALATLLVLRNVDDGAEPGVDTTPTTAVPAVPAPIPAEGESAIVAGGRALLPLPGSGLDSLVGQDAEGRAVTIQSVVADEGFWVGNDTTNRIFVFLTDEAKAAEGEPPFQVQAGQRVDFTGTVRANPDDLPPFGLEAAEGAEQLRQQGHHIEVTEIALSN